MSTNNSRLRPTHMFGILLMLLILIAIYPQEVNAATEITISDMSSPSYLRVKESRQINAAITGAIGDCSEMKYKSSNPLIASVSKTGIVKGKRSGQTTITISVKETVTTNTGSITKTIKKKMKIRVTKYRHISHRGLQSKAPPNSQKAYVFAGKAHIWGMEADLRPSKPDDNGEVQVYVSHDLNLRQSCGVNRKITDMTSEEIDKLRIIEGVNAKKYNQKVCTLTSFLDVCKKYDAVPYLDIKSKYSMQVVQMIVDQLAARDQLQNCRLVGYVDSTMCSIRTYAKETYGTAPSIILNVKLSNPKNRTVMQQVSYAKSKGYEGVSVSKTAMSKKVDTYCRNKKMEVTLWAYNASDKSGMLKQLKTYKSVYSDMVNVMVE